MTHAQLEACCRYLKEGKPWGELTNLGRRFGITRQTVAQQVGQIEEACASRVGRPPGPDERRELRRRVEELEAANGNLERRAQALEQQWCEEMARQGRAKEEITLELSVAGTPAPTVAKVQERAFCVPTPNSASTVKRRARKASEVAKWLMEKFFVGQGLQADLDEIFIGDNPLLLVVEFASLAVVGLKLARDRSGKTWTTVLGAFGALRRASSDQAKGILQALKERGVVHLPDIYHIK